LGGSHQKKIIPQKIAPLSLYQPTTTTITTIAAAARNGPLAPITHADRLERAQWGPLGATTLLSATRESKDSRQEKTMDVVSCKHGTQDVCTVNKIRKYHSMCKTVDSGYIAIETQQRIFC
jgi:hypothetical protein